MLRYQETEIVHISPQQIWGLVTCTLVRVSRPHGQLFADWCHNVQSVVLNLVPFGRDTSCRIVHTAVKNTTIQICIIL